MKRRSAIQLSMASVASLASIGLPQYSGLVAKTKIQSTQVIDASGHYSGWPTLAKRLWSISFSCFRYP